MSNVLRDEKKEQVIALGRLGWPLRRIEAATGVRRETVGAYLKAAGIAVRPPRGWGRKPPSKPANEVITDFSLGKGSDEGHLELVEAKPANEVITGFNEEKRESEESTGTEGEPKTREPACRGRVPTLSASEEYRDEIESGLSRGRNAMAIWQDLVSNFGFSKSYQSVQRYVRKLRGIQSRQACGIITTAAGEESQVDYGSGPMVRDPQSGKYRRTRLFVMTLGHSRKSVRMLVFRSSARTWAELHEKAFRRLGGATRVVVLDNLREGVLKPDIYDPTLNPLYRDMLAHYGAVAMPCRVRDPDRKGKVESGVGHAQKTPLKGLRFDSLEEAQAYLDRWEERWADTRIHGTTKRQVSAMFAEERPELLPLPIEPFRYYQYGERTVHLDGCVEVEAAYYSAPPGWVSRRVKVQWDALTVRLLDPRTGQLLREHLHQKRGHHRINPLDSPKRMRMSTSKLLWRAQQAGPNIGELCQAMYRQQGEPAIRRVLGVLSLAKKYGTAAVDDACAAALEMGVAQYRFVRRYIERNPQLPLSLRQVDPLIRELVVYRDLINARTKEVENEPD
ncbi:MAG TPA: IS21 family transposase [Blastocatellia bacterium]|nr:IS21 family transposase [Blastocatellia bacterium]